VGVYYLVVCAGNYAGSYAWLCMNASPPNCKLQTEEYIFWDCKLYKDQQATMIDILSENSKKEYPQSVTELLRLEEKRFVQGISYFINKILKFI
jgi:protein associated with RNAse G/E